MSIEGTAGDRYPALDALRGVAAFGVLFYHLKGSGSTGSENWLLPTFASGYLAVDLFFVLSGFVICHAYADRLRGALTFKKFMVARFVRLQPVIAIGTFIGFVLALAQRAVGSESAPGLAHIATALPANLLLLPDILVPWGIFLFNPPAWSVFYELVANAIYAFAVRCDKIRATTLWMPATKTSAPIVVCLIGYIGIFLTIGFYGSLDRGVVLQDWPCALARITFSFTLGLLIHKYRSHWKSRMNKVYFIWLLIVCLGLLAPDLTGWARMLYDLAFVTIAAPMLVMLGAACLGTPRTDRISSWLGMISYPLYAVHAPIKHFAVATLPAAYPLVPILVAATSITVAWGAAKIDPSLRRWLAAHIGRTFPGHALPLSVSHRPSRGN